MTVDALVSTGTSTGWLRCHESEVASNWAAELSTEQAADNAPMWQQRHPDVMELNPIAGWFNVHTGNAILLRAEVRYSYVADFSLLHKSAFGQINEISSSVLDGKRTIWAHDQLEPTAAAFSNQVDALLGLGQK